MSTRTETVTITTPVCRFCGEEGTLEIPAEVELAVRERTAPIQDILPDHSPDEREQIITGIHGACWDAKFGAFDIFDCEDDPEEG